MEAEQEKARVEWPVFALLLDDGGLYWTDMSWGSRHGAGEGWIAALPWGEAKLPSGICTGDNRCLVDGDYVVAVTPLTPALRSKQDAAGKPDDYDAKKHSDMYPGY